MAFNFPDGASNGDTHTASNGVVYRFDGTVWVVDRPSTSTSFDAKYLNTTGDGIVSSSAQVTDGSGIISGSTHLFTACLLYTSPSPRDAHESRMPSSA